VLSKTDAFTTLVAAIESLEREPIHLAGSAIGRWYHIGAFFHSAAERDRVLLPFTREGLSQGHKVIHVVDPADGNGHGHPEVSVVEADDAFLREGCVELLRGAQGLAFTRMIAFARPNHRGIIEHEARLNDALRAFETVVICAYELSKFDSDIIVDAFRAHPAVVIKDGFHKNPFYVPPDPLIRELRQRYGNA
jgi:MEDS: MEthanogen/methylotroph, DcmR Sensory domain